MCREYYIQRMALAIAEAMSIGMAIFPLEGKDVPIILARVVAAALHHAPANGRGRHVEFQEELIRYEAFFKGELPLTIMGHEHYYQNGKLTLK